MMTLAGVLGANSRGWLSLPRPSKVKPVGFPACSPPPTLLVARVASPPSAEVRPLLALLRDRLGLAGALEGTREPRPGIYFDASSVAWVTSEGCSAAVVLGAAAAGVATVESCLSDIVWIEIDVAE